MSGSLFELIHIYKRSKNSQQRLKTAGITHQPIVGFLEAFEVLVDFDLVDLDLVDFDLVDFFPDVLLLFFDVVCDFEGAAL